MAQLDKAQAEIDELVAEGKALIERMLVNVDPGFIYKYQVWYTRASSVVGILLPDRILEFKSYYEIDPKREVLGLSTWTIQDFCKNVVPSGITNFNPYSQVAINLQNQVGILHSVTSHLTSVIGNIQYTILADVRDHELETAQSLKAVSPRAAGALAGVVLERHLNQTCDARGLIIQKKKPTLKDYSEALKSALVIKVAAWRKLSYLADLRNICCHSGDTEPTADQVDDLLAGVNWALKIIS